MKIKNKELIVKRVVLSALMAVMGFAASAKSTVTVDAVVTGDPWTKISVNYTLAGIDTSIEHKVAFSVTAGGKTASITNAAAKLKNIAYTKSLNTASLFGKQIADTKAKIKVTLIAIKPPVGVQLWKDGPFWAEYNVGATKPEAYGDLLLFDNAAKAVNSKMGALWRVPTRAELQGLVENCSYTWETKNNVRGISFKSKTSDKTIFLPSAGFDQGSGRVQDTVRGRYLSSTEVDADTVRRLAFYETDNIVDVATSPRTTSMSVRAVR